MNLTRGAERMSKLECAWCGGIGGMAIALLDKHHGWNLTTSFILLLAWCTLVVIIRMPRNDQD